MADKLATFDPFAFFAGLRAQGPVVSREGAWLALSHETCSRVLLEHAEFSSEPASAGLRPASPRLSMLSTDPPDHARLRAATTEAFRHAQVMALHPGLQETARLLVAGLGDRAELELMAGLAEPLAQETIAQVVGIAQADRSSFKRWGAAVMAAAGRGTRPCGTAEDQADVAQLKAFLCSAIQSASVDPDRLLGVLGAFVRTGRLTEDEAVSNAVAVLVGGIGTTAHLIGNTIVALVEHDGAYAEVHADRRLVPRAVEETSRHAPAVLAVPRWARHNTVLGGQAIGAGSVVLAVMGSANRDPDIYPDGWLFDIHRNGARPMAFGCGPHHCPGRGLATEVAHIALNALLDRYPALTPAPGPWVERAASMFVYAPTRVQVSPRG